MTNDLMTSWPDLPLAIVIGAGGMGMAVARRLGQHHQVLLADIDELKLANQVRILRDEGLNVDAIRCDLCDPDSVQSLAGRVGELGGFRVLAHVAGLSPSMADWRTIMKVNLLGATLMEQALRPLALPGSAAIFISSLAGHMFTYSDSVVALLDDPLADDYLDRLVVELGEEPSSNSSYALSKFALNRMCQTRAWDWGQRRARILSLSPGLIATPMGMLEFKNQPLKYDLLAGTPLQRQGGMLEIADAVEFLASDRASFISGIDLLVDGGLRAALKHPR